MDLAGLVGRLGITSIAVPSLGCGNGGLDRAQVRPLIARTFEALPHVDVRAYARAGAPRAAGMLDHTRRPRWTAGKAALVDMIACYGERTLDVSIIEVQKLMHFLRESGEPLRLQCQKARYGPYADNLQKVFQAVEGHFLIGYGDGSLPVASAEPTAPLRARRPRPPTSSRIVPTRWPEANRSWTSPEVTNLRTRWSCCLASTGLPPTSPNQPPTPAPRPVRWPPGGLAKRP